VVRQAMAILTGRRVDDAHLSGSRLRTGMTARRDREHRQRVRIRGSNASTIDPRHGAGSSLILVATLRNVLSID
jgi:hypothetical protein